MELDQIKKIAKDKAEQVIGDQSSFTKQSVKNLIALAVQQVLQGLEAVEAQEVEEESSEVSTETEDGGDCSEEGEIATKPKKRKGRPPGSKNKKKEVE